MRLFIFLAAFIVMGAAGAVAGDVSGASGGAVPAATAQQQQVPLPQEPPYDAQMVKAKADYEAAIKNLTPEQLAALEALEKEFAATIETDMKVLFRSAEVDHCLRTDRFFKVDQNIYVPKFLEWRKKLKDEQLKEQTAHRIKRQQYDYVPLKVLNEYYIYQQKLLVMAGKRMVYQQIKSGAYNGTNCDELASRLKSGE